MRIGIYPGTFDPVTNGHLDIIKRGSKLFDKLYVLVPTNINKNSLFSKEIHSLISITNGFRSCERINTFVLLPNSFQIGEELSAKQEMIRPKIVAKYEDEIKKLFK